MSSPNPADPEAPRTRGGGPKTPEGKARSRQNALRHGLRSTALLPGDMADAVEARTRDMVERFRPASPHARWLVGRAALATVQLDRCTALIVDDLARRVERAGLAWDDDRRQAAEDLGARLGKEPARVAAALRRTRHGAEWLLARWEGLGEVLARAGTWDESRRALALDLLGVPEAMRDARPDLPADADGPALAALVDRESARLREALSGSLADLDESARARAEAGLPDHDADSRRLIRYEAACWRDLRWALAELHREPEAASAPRPAPASPPEARVEPARDPRPSPIPAPAPSPAPPPALLPPPAPPNRKARRAAERRVLQAVRRQARAGIPAA